VIYRRFMNDRALFLVFPCARGSITFDMVRIHPLQNMGCWVCAGRCGNAFGNVVHEVRYIESACIPVTMGGQLMAFVLYLQCEAWTILAGSLSSLVITLGGLHIL